MIRKAAAAVATAVVLLSATGCTAPTEPRYPKERGEEETPKPPPTEAHLVLPSTVVYG